LLLRSVSKHVAEQNWAAVAIDFVIVVVGVFIGIQVANLNETRIENQQSARFTDRLLDDLRLEAWSFVLTREYYDDVLASTDRAVSALEGRSALSDEELLINAYRATQYTRPPAARETYDELISIGSPPAARETYDELISIGSINLIRDESLRDLASRLYAQTEFEEKRTDEERVAPYRQLFRMIMPIEIQHALLRTCGDKRWVRLDYSSIVNMLDYACSTGLSDQQIASAANTLRTHPDVLPYLRLRMADVETRITDTSGLSWVEQLREIAPDMP
jgi:hypothetical protein